jgi:DNA-directed RNA polymerase subunit RPC12/RpoP
MTDDFSTVDDLINMAESGWLSIIECTNCGFRGQMHSTGEPVPKQYWECQECGVECRHEIVMKSSVGEDNTR